MSGDPSRSISPTAWSRTSSRRLSAVKSFFVIARNSSFTYKGRAVDVKQVGRELGVRYVLEGSFGRQERVRITGQLIERSDWASHVGRSVRLAIRTTYSPSRTRSRKRLSPPSSQAFAAGEIERAKRKPTEDLDAYDLYLLALPDLHSSNPRQLSRR